MIKRVKTFSIKPSQVERNWYLLDASKAPVGRIASVAATYLTGKHKPSYTPHIDGGDGIIVINAVQAVFTGNKLIDKKYYRHSGYPGALKQRTVRQQLTKDPTKIFMHAVKGMLPKNKLQAGRLKRLKIFLDDNHNMAAQKPIKIGVDNG